MKNRKKNKSPSHCIKWGVLAIVLILLILLLCCFLASPKPAYVMLSFDTELVDEKDSVSQILDILKQGNAKATFFVMGQYAQEYPEIVKRMVGEGHEVACHSFSHPDFKKISREEKKKELFLCSNAIENITGMKPIGFRAPYHKIDAETYSLLKESGFKYDASQIECLGLFFPESSIKELKISYFIIPLSDVIGLYYMHLPSRFYFWLLEHAGGDYVSLSFHPHHIIKHKAKLGKTIKYYNQKNITFITHKDFAGLK